MEHYKGFFSITRVIMLVSTFNDFNILVVKLLEMDLLNKELAQDDTCKLTSFLEYNTKCYYALKINF